MRNFFRFQLLVGLIAGEILGAGGAMAQADSPRGIATPIVLQPFVEQQDLCTAPGLERTLAFAQDNEREFMQGVARGLVAAARDRGLAFRVECRANDANA